FPLDSHWAILSHMASFIMAGAAAPVFVAAGAGLALVPTRTFSATGWVTTVSDARVREASRPSTSTSLKVLSTLPSTPAWVTFFSPLYSSALSVETVSNGRFSETAAVLLVSTRETLVTMLFTTGAVPGWETRSLPPKATPASRSSVATSGAVVVLLELLPSATRLTVFGVEISTNDPVTSSWESLGAETAEELATPSSDTNPPTSEALVLTVLRAPSRLMVTALARFTLITVPLSTLASRAGEIRSASFSSTLAALTTWSTVPPKVWTELTLPSTFKVTVLLLPTKATSPSTSAESTRSCAPTLKTLNFPSVVKNLTTSAHNCWTVRARGKTHRDTHLQKPTMVHSDPYRNVCSGLARRQTPTKIRRSRYPKAFPDPG